ncbi:hypothetical protein L2E82_47627 [Cichorium intybus]|uniref:Uncharacterized protein n=1 Tax=Cichorium intybus TaxID=13427 RepID=A0ACB8YV98_CICIN|nr:hypothetical protein L2E82_47627 [Cichorium intybus]
MVDIFLKQNYILGAFKPSCNISITLNDAKTPKQVPLKKENGQMAMVPLFQSQESIAGKICVDPVQGKKVERNGIKIELLGQIGVFLLLASHNGHVREGCNKGMMSCMSQLSTMVAEQVDQPQVGLKALASS